MSMDPDYLPAAKPPIMWQVQMGCAAERAFSTLSVSYYLDKVLADAQSHCPRTLEWGIDGDILVAYDEDGGYDFRAYRVKVIK